MIRKFDLIVIGGGTGLDIANAAASRGYRVAIVEKDMLGGTCLNRGCIPSKLLIHSADIVQMIKNAQTFGIKVSNISVDFQKIVKRVNKITDNESNKIKEELLKSENPVLYTEQCHFIDNKKVAFKRTSDKEEKKEETNDISSHSFNDDTIMADNIVIATGTVPKIPDIQGLVHSGFLTSDEAFRLRKQPKVITFIGGGYIACELAHFFGSLGTKVNIIQRNDYLIPNEDKEISEKFTDIFRGQYQVYLGYNTESVSKVLANNNDEKIFRILAKNKTNGKIIEVDSDQLVISTGREANSSILNLEKTGVHVDRDGFIIVDKNLETTTPGIFALGDVIGKYQFKHSATLEAQYAYHNIFAKKSQEKIPVDYTAMPHAIFSSPQVAGVGFTEQQLKEQKNIKYLKSIYHYIDTGMGLIIDDKKGFVKFLVDKKSRKILGCHILGTNASTLIHEVLVSMRSGEGTIDSISNTIHIHPALSEVVGRAASNI
ncbi:MAG TPA: dihydrolipoyl dehydrogenase [Candidatus Nitrosocosmicus sp.]|nr:dihydrolipoyl dehydrogenase [Candidatus Nitrosocosmicus sp.]